MKKVVLVVAVALALSACKMDWEERMDQFIDLINKQCADGGLTATVTSPEGITVTISCEEWLSDDLLRECLEAGVYAKITVNGMEVSCEQIIFPPADTATESVDTETDPPSSDTDSGEASTDSNTESVDTETDTGLTDTDTNSATEADTASDTGECVTDDRECAGMTLRVCVAGVWQDYSCDPDVCDLDACAVVAGECACEIDTGTGLVDTGTSEASTDTGLVSTDTEADTETDTTDIDTTDTEADTETDTTDTDTTDTEADTETDTNADTDTGEIIDAGDDGGSGGESGPGEPCYLNGDYQGENLGCWANLMCVPENIDDWSQGGTCAVIPAYPAPLWCWDENNPNTPGDLPSCHDNGPGTWSPPVWSYYDAVGDVRLTPHCDGALTSLYPVVIGLCASVDTVEFPADEWPDHRICGDADVFGFIVAYINP